MSRELFVLTGTLLAGGVAMVAGVYAARARGLEVGQRQLAPLAGLAAIGIVAAFAVAYLPGSSVLGPIAVAVLVVWFAGRVYWSRSGGPPLMTRDLAAPTLLGLILVVGVMVAIAILTR